MGAEQTSGLGVVERPDLSLEGLDELSRVVQELPTIDTEDDDLTGPEDYVKDPATSFLETFASSAQLEAFEMAKEGSITSKSKEETLWRRFRAGILWHPSIVGKLAVLSGAGSLDDLGEPAWKDQGACKEDIRFVSAGSHRTIQETRSLMDVCQGCPVLQECQDHISANRMDYGVWAGVSRSKGTGYHDDGTPITLEEQREKVEARHKKTA